MKLGLAIPQELLTPDNFRFARQAGCTQVFVGLGKSLYGYMYSGLGFSAWFSDFNSDYFVVGSEFLRTNGILNSVVVSNYQIPWWSVFVSFLKILPFPEGFYSVDISYFSNNFQNDVFPWVDYGIAFNPLAEAYAWAGLWGVAFYALFIPMMLSTLWRLYLNSGGPLFKAILILAGVTVAFWVHRNTLGSTFGYIRNAVYPSLVIYFLAFSCATILRGGR